MERQPDSSSDAVLAEALHLQEVNAHSSISYKAISGGHSASTLRFLGTVKAIQCRSSLMREVLIVLDRPGLLCFLI